jgi:hypothetical protein
MSEQDPTRLREFGSGAPEGLRALFDAGASDLPSDAELARVAARLDATLAAPNGSAPNSGLSTGAKIGIAAAVAVGVAALVAGLGTKPAPEPPPPSSARVTPPGEVSVEEPVGQAPSQVAPTESTPALPPSAPSPEATRGARGPAAEAPARPAESEAAFLERARTALASNPALALSLANQHRSRYPSGVLGQEREVIAIEALKRLGRTSEAERRSSEFSNRYPGSAYRQKLDAGTR